MTRLYIIPVNEEWMSHFDRTVRERVPVPEEAPEDLHRSDEERIWGTTIGRQKRRFFEEMESGDPLLFSNKEKFYAAGRVGTAFESPDVGEELWGDRERSFIFTVTDFQDIAVDHERVARLLEYEEGWGPNRFVRVSPDAVSSLLKEYNSIEEAFQDFQTEDNGPDIIEEDSEDEPREHTKIQHYLVQLGLQHGYDVYVAKNDKNRTYDGTRLGEECVENLKIPAFSSAATNIIEYVDVIWLDSDYIVKMFEVESTTSVFSGILRMTDFTVKVPNIAVEMYIVAPDDDEDKVRKEINRPTFQTILDDAEYSHLRYISFEDVRERYDTVRAAGPLQDVF